MTIKNKHDVKNYRVTWTNKYHETKVNDVRAINESQAKMSVPYGDVLLRFDKIEELIWDDKLSKLIVKPKPYANSKVPVYEGINRDFIEYGSEFVPNQGEIFDFNEAHAIAVDLLKIGPNTVLLQEEKDGSWWVGKIDPINKNAHESTRFKEPFYQNYDLYETGPGTQGPGGGFYQNMDKYKSVSDFLRRKRKRKMKKRKMAFLLLLCKYGQDKNNIDFPIDDQVTPILGDEGAYSDSIPIGGITDEYLPLNDFEGKSPDKLNFSRDYIKEPLDLEAIMEKYLPSAAEPSLYGLPDGIDPKEDLDAPSLENSWHGTTDSGNTMYDKMWI